MSRIRRSTLAAAALSAAALMAVPTTSSAESMYAVTSGNRLITFDSAAPRGIGTPKEISGLQSGEAVIGIDVRPATGQLFAIGSTSRIYIVNPTSAVARAVGTTAFTPVLTGSNLGFAFNAVTDRIRVVTEANQNLRLNPNTGATAGVDTNLAYAAGDPGAGTNPAVVGAAYTNSFAGATSTQLYDIDSARNTLVVQNPPNAGTLTTVGALGIDVAGRAGFDIGTSNVAYAALTLQGQTRASLYTINLTNGQATPAAQNAQIGTSEPIVALAANGPSATDGNDPTVVVANPNVKRVSLVLSQGVAYTVACNEACNVSGQLRRGNTLLGSADSFVEQPGRVAVNITLTAAGRAALQGVTSGTLSLGTTATDFLGNGSTVTRTITLTQ